VDLAPAGGQALEHEPASVGRPGRLASEFIDDLDGATGRADPDPELDADR
jgi:hypothetical protein